MGPDCPAAKLPNSPSAHGARSASGGGQRQARSWNSGAVTSSVACGDTSSIKEEEGVGVCLRAAIQHQRLKPSSSQRRLGPRVSHLHLIDPAPIFGPPPHYESGFQPALE